MNISIYNANDNGDEQFNRTVTELVSFLEADNEVNYVNLADMDLKYCCGCWDCWVKTPGKCRLQDDITWVYETFMASDLVIFAAQMRMGFPNAMMKKVNDRLVPLVHPYIELVNKECHHLPRYEKYPVWGLLLQKEEEGLESDINFVKELYERTTLNIKSSLAFTCTTDQPINQIAHELSHI